MTCMACVYDLYDLYDLSDLYDLCDLHLLVSQRHKAGTPQLLHVRMGCGCSIIITADDVKMKLHAAI